MWFKKLWLSEGLKSRIMSDLVKIIPSVCLVEFAILMLWYLADYNLRIDSNTQRYLYSSLVQAFAALAGLLLTILVFMYQRVKDVQASFIEDAYRDALTLNITFPADYDLSRKSLLDWFNGAFKHSWESAETYAATVEKKHERPAQADRGDADVSRMTKEYSHLRTLASQYRQVVSHLGRFKEVGSFFEDRMSVLAILAVGSAFIMIILTVALLVIVDQLGIMHAYMTVLIALASGISVLYAVSFFRGMLHMFFGLSKIPGFIQTMLPEPERAEEALHRIRLMMNWQQ
jgi:hypothetical protein